MSDPFKKKRKIIRRRRLKGDELFNFLNQENYFEKDISEKDKRRILIEAGYAIPYKELSTEQITAFASELIRKDDKYQKFLDFKYQQISLEDQAGDYNFESEKYNSFYKNINRNKPSLDIKTSIYLIKDLDNHGVKIGMSNNIERRMREIKKQYKVDNIKLISYITLGSKEAAEIMEKELHNKFGADSFRVYEMFMGPLDKSKPWSTKGLQGSHRFLQKVWKVCIENKNKIDDSEASIETLRLMNMTIKKVTEDLEILSFNTAVSQMMIFVNHLNSLNHYNSQIIKNFLIILNPFAPHITEEIYDILGFSSNQITNQNWPAYDEKYLKSDEVKIAVQINGKLRATVDLIYDCDDKAAFEIILNNDKIKKYIKNEKIIKKIYVKNKIANIVIK